MLSRRHMLRNSALSLAGLALGPRRALGQMMNMEPAGPSPSLTLFADPLRIPPRPFKPEIEDAVHVPPLLDNVYTSDVIWPRWVS